jgi:hypothetical protein
MTDVPKLGPRFEPEPRGCSTAGCDRPHHGRGLCKTCYSRAYYHLNKEHAVAIRRAARQKRAAKRETVAS